MHAFIRLIALMCILTICFAGLRLLAVVHPDYFTLTHALGILAICAIATAGITLVLDQ